MKFKLIHKISIIQEEFLVFYNLLRGLDITRSGAESGPQVVHPWYISYDWKIVSLIIDIAMLCGRFRRLADFRNSFIYDIKPKAVTSRVKYLRVFERGYSQVFDLGQRFPNFSGLRPTSKHRENLGTR